jgi:hypothetical protein
MRTIGLTAFAVVCVAQPCFAEDVPRFDIRSFCAANGEYRGGPVSCRQQEEATRIELDARWTTFPKQRRHFCVQSVSFRRKEQRSYGTLADCLDEAKTG